MDANDDGMGIWVVVGGRGRGGGCGWPQGGWEPMDGGGGGGDKWAQGRDSPTRPTWSRTTSRWRAKEPRGVLRV